MVGKASDGEGRWTVPADSEPDRLDRQLAKLAGISRGEARRLLDAGGVWLNGKRVRNASRAAGPGQEIRCRLDAAKVAAVAKAALEAGPQPRWVHKERTVGILWKPGGIVVSASKSTVHGTLEAWVRAQSTIEYVAFHHRLDRDAQGLICVALHKTANAGMAQAFRERKAKRVYRVLVEGRVDAAKGTWHHLQLRKRQRRYALPFDGGDQLGDGQEMKATFRRVQVYGERTLLEVRLQTGRTHQVRLQCQSVGHPVVGDTLYGRRDPLGLCLQAMMLRLPHPTSRGRLEFELPVPEDWGLQEGSTSSASTSDTNS